MAYKYKRLTQDQIRRLSAIEGGMHTNKVLPQLVDDALDVMLGELPDAIPMSQIDGLVDALGEKLSATIMENISLLGEHEDIEVDEPVASALDDTFDDEEVEAALDAKADQVALVNAIGEVNASLSDIHARIDDIISALISAGMMEEEED